jgi:hypothetical protein
MPEGGSLRTYIVVGRCRASAFIDENEDLTFTYKYGSNEPAQISFRTRFLEKGFEVKVPEEFWIEATGTNNTLISAAETLANGAKDIANIIALTTNASIGPIEVELAYDATPGVNEREYFQSFMPDKTINNVPGRKINCEITAALVGLIGQHPDKDKIMRAVSQYSIALENWFMGSELPCVSHLYMGMEALKGITLKHHLSQTGVAKKQLAEQWGFHVGGRETIDQYLDHEVRKRILFQNDTETHRKAKKASDDLEHGFTNFGALRPIAKEAIVSTAKYLRTAILDLAGVDEDRKRIILTKPYDTPRGPSKIVKYIWGLTPTAFWLAIRRLCPHIRDCSYKGKRCVDVGTLQQCRDAFDQAIGRSNHIWDAPEVDIDVPLVHVPMHTSKLIELEEYDNFDQFKSEGQSKEGEATSASS